MKKSDSIIYNYKINCNTSKQYLNFLVSADESFLLSSDLIFNKFFSELVVGAFKVVLNDLINSYITFEYVDSYRTKLNDRYNVLRNISKHLYCGNNQEFICISFEIEEKKDSIGLLKILFPICFLHELTKMGVNLKKSNIAKNDFAKNDLSKISIDCEIRTESIKKSINDLLKIKIGDIVLFSKKKKIYINDKEFIYE